jgi:DNA polymerase gamma 1
MIWEKLQTSLQISVSSLLEDERCKILIHQPSSAPRNSVGVQLLAPSLHAQVFPSTTVKVPPVKPEALSLCQHHLQTHGLQPEQASTIPPISFDLPPLQGKDLSQHFWNLGKQAAQPWLGMAHSLAEANVIEPFPEGIAPDDAMGQNQEDKGKSLAADEWLSLSASLRSEGQPRPPKWLKKPGWVRYPIKYSEDGTARALGEGAQVEYPLAEDGALVFDVETMVQESPFAVMATAVGLHAWYAWLNPWLLQEGDRCHEKDHLIPFGPSDATLRSKQPARLIVGHNVGYDRARILDEYSLMRSNIRFIDTMSLHVATRGISSPQRGAWIKHSKGRELEKMLEQDNVEEVKKEVIRSILGGEDVDEEIIASLDLDELVRELQNGGDSTVSVDQLASSSSSDSEITSSASQLWQDVTSKNSLVDVARLHCNIELSKEVRNVFVDGTSREEILSMLDRLLQYCATDVLVTQKVFRQVWPAFIANCPNPATAAGILGLGSAILPVDDEWIDYINRCDAKYELALNDVKANLLDLAEQLKAQGTQGVSWDEAMEAANARTMDIEAMPDLTYSDKLAKEEQERLRIKLWWEKEEWASQLDWTPKKPKKDRTKTAGLDTLGESNVRLVPRWYRDKVLASNSGLGPSMAISPVILRLHYDGRPIDKRADGKWVIQGSDESQDIDIKGSPLRKAFLKKGQGPKVESQLGQVGESVLTAIREGSGGDEVRDRLREAADALVLMTSEDPDIIAMDAQLSQLDWTPSEEPPVLSEQSADEGTATQQDLTWWPKWYWDLYKSATGQLEVTIRSKIAPLLLCVTWQGCPLHNSREHGWLFRYDPQESKSITTRQKSVDFTHPADQAFRNDIARTVSSRLAVAADKARGKGGDIIDPNSIVPRYYKVPHLAGDGSNVGSPFSKGFLPLFEKGIMQSEHHDEVGRTAARNALEMNAQCSYWIGVRDRVRQQMVVWQGQGGCDTQFASGASGARQDDETDKQRRKGIILPPIIPMGTVTRRAIEKTWLTASNAKANRVGSELKALVKAPPGWSIVGADVDSQELWICSVMGDAQFGVHGATAIGWMTLEGSKSMGTDLHSKTAGILGTSRNQAKVFNYSRIYGAGIRHSSQLLLQANPTMSTEEATKKARELYANTKGTNTQRKDLFGRKFWYGGTESYVFNKLEEIALSEQPKTPALDCGVTAALSRKYLPKASNGRQGEGDYMPSRINWVVQSSGVDYLHLLITSMEHLIVTYDLQARFMISVHDEVRYLAKDEDAHRVALALQISNLWTRSMFAHKLQMDDLPQGVAFFAQVDIDKVLRKEADDPCVTPSQPVPIPPGTAEDIQGTLARTNGGSLYADGRPMKQVGRKSIDVRPHLIPEGENIDVSLPHFSPSNQTHRSMGDRGLRFLQAQASDNLAEITALEQRVKLSERQGQLEVKPVSSRKSSKPSQLHGVTRRAATSKAKEPSPFGSTFSYHSSARASSSLSMLPPSLSAIVGMFPARPLIPRVPFYKTKEHRMKVLTLYRSLLKECPAEHHNIRQMIKALTRAKRHCTSPRQTEELVQRGLTLLDTFRRHKASDEDARTLLAKQDAKIADRQHERKWNISFGHHLRRLEEESKPVPRVTGALLPPTVNNPPLLRYKPVQPDRITMMIKKRILERIRRIERFHDNEEIQRQIRSEVKMWSAIPKKRGDSQLTGWEDQKGWLRQPLELRKALSEVREREQRRAKMVYSTSMLMYAKRVRKARQNWAAERNKSIKEQRIGVAQK